MLNPVQQIYWKTKPAEELFDLETDHDEVKNLANSPAHKPILERMRRAQQDLAKKIRDVGFLPENEVHARAGNGAPYDVGHDDSKYPFHRVFAMAEAASSMKPELTPQLIKGIADQDSAVRYWASLGFLMRGADAVKANASVLRQALSDPAPAVQIAAGEALGRYGNDNDSALAAKALITLAAMDKNSVYVSMMALNALDYMGHRAAPFKDEIKKLPITAPGTIQKFREYVPRLHQKTVEDIG